MKKLILILIVATFLRLFQLTQVPNGLFWDEMDTGYQAYSLIKTGKDYFGNTLPLFFHSLADYRTPVYIYSAVPIVATFGLTSFSVRFVSVVWGVIGVLGVALLFSLITRRPSVGWIAALTYMISPWHLQYSRKSVETISLNTLFVLALACFYRGLRSTKWLAVSGLLFGLCTAAYSPAKVFVPLFLVGLGIIHFRQLITVKASHLVVAALLFLVVCVPVVGDGIFGKSGMRFHDVSVFTDPIVPTEVDFKRLVFGLGEGRPAEPGMKPDLLSQLNHNKLEEWSHTIVKNYLETFSTEFLFSKGDPELRHSPSKDRFAQFYVIEAVALLVGLFVLSKREVVSWRSASVLALWMLLAPLPAALTRDGGNHAARLFILFPGLVMVISLGIMYLKRMHKLLTPFYVVILLISGGMYLSYYYTHYRLESAKSFDWGFDQVVETANRESPNYDRVIVDLFQASPLMNYLFFTPVDPAEFQARMPLQYEKLISDTYAFQMGNIYLLPVRSGLNLQDLPGNNLVISASERGKQGMTGLSIDKEVNYPGGQPAFIIWKKTVNIDK